MRTGRGVVGEKRGTDHRQTLPLLTALTAVPLCKGENPVHCWAKHKLNHDPGRAHTQQHHHRNHHPRTHYNYCPWSRPANNQQRRQPVFSRHNCCSDHCSAGMCTYHHPDAHCACHPQATPTSAWPRVESHSDCVNRDRQCKCGCLRRPQVTTASPRHHQLGTRHALCQQS